MTFKVGDKVRLRPKLIEGCSYGGLTLWNNMSVRKKQLFTITKITDTYIFVKENGITWTTQMLCPAARTNWREKLK